MPEALAAVDRDIGDGALVLGAVDEAEVVGTSGTGLEIDSEELLLQGGLDAVEEGGLLLGLDGVDAAESKAEETIVVSVLSELGRDLGGGFDCLGSSGDGANDDLVGVDITARTGAVLVADLPGGALDLLARGGWVVFRVASRLARWSFGREDPTVGLSVVCLGLSGYTNDLQIRAACVEVQVQSLSANGDWAEV